MSKAAGQFGKHLKQARLELKMSQEELAEGASVHVSYVSQLERGVKSPTLDVILRLGRALNLAGSELVARTEASLIE